MGFNNKHIKFILLRSKLKAQNLPSIQRESVKCDICNWKAASSKKTTITLDQKIPELRQRIHIIYVTVIKHVHSDMIFLKWIS